jgi:hypothetical protein
MPQRDQLSIGRRADLDVVPRLGAVGRNRKALVAGRDQFDGTVQLSRYAGDDGRARRDGAFRAERAPDIVVDDTDLVGVNAQLFGDAVEYMSGNICLSGTSLASRDG